MTIVEDRPVVASVEPTPPDARRHTSRLATWRFAVRLARREVRRRPGRTLLVMLLVAVPVIAMTGASIVGRTTSETGAENFARRYGTADAVLYDDGEADRTDLEGPALPQLPTGTQVNSYISTSTAMWRLADDGVDAEFVSLTDVDLTHPIVDRAFDLSSGRVPSAAGETLLSPALADEFGVGVGDRLTFLRPDLELDVVGIGQRVAWFDEPLMVVSGLDRSLLRPEFARIETLVDLPDSMTVEQQAVAFDDISRAGFAVETVEGFHGAGQGVGARQLAWGWVAGVLAFVAVGVVIAAAFATSARRQLVTIGQLASNGASPALTSRTMGLQGMWTGLLGAAVGVPVAVLGCVLLARLDLISRLAGRPIGGLEFAPFDYVVIAATAVLAATVAASVPAHSAARIPVLSALAGRRPVGQPPAWLAPTGAVTFAGGLLLLAAAGTVDNAGDLVVAVAILGALGVLFGVICTSPLIVAGVARAGGRRGGVIRLASRSLGRARARSAAVLTAITVVGIVAMIASVVVGAAEAADGYFDEDPRVVKVNFVAHVGGDQAFDESPDGVIDEPPIVATPIPQLVRRDVERILPAARWIPIQQVVFDPPPYRWETGEPVEESAVGSGTQVYSGVVVADAAVLDAADLDRAQRAELEDTGVLVISPFASDQIAVSTLGDPILVDVSGSNALVERAERSMTSDGVIVFDESDYESVYVANRSALSISEIFVTPEFVIENGLMTTVASYRVENPNAITRAQYDELNESQALNQDDAFVETASAPGFEVGRTRGDGWYANAPYPATRAPWNLIQLAVAGASLVLVLAVVAIGLSLAAAESRDEREVLRAVGAAPSSLRRVAATKAFVLTLAASLVAVPVGYVVMFVITRSVDERNVSAPFPSTLSVALVAVIPVVAWLVTLFTSSVAQRLRPVAASTLAPG